MANEIKTDVRLTASKGGMEVDRREQKTDIAMTGDSITHAVIEITASGGEVLVEAAELGTAGLIFIKNLDSTNYVTFGTHATSNHTIKLLAGESCLFRAAGAIYGLSNTSACNVEYIIIEE
tara:strand:+ start:1500 stop:1862 length:363 start_codon:yes stop_codon:yes gene_type:complete